jgi:hypothetical protein
VRAQEARERVRHDRRLDHVESRLLSRVHDFMTSQSAIPVLAQRLDARLVGRGGVEVEQRRDDPPERVLRVRVVLLRAQRRLAGHRAEDQHAARGSEIGGKL